MSSHKFFFGIDPGYSSGAVCLLSHHNEILFLSDLPTTSLSKKTKGKLKKETHLDFEGLAEMFLSLFESQPLLLTHCLVVIEDVHAMSTQGVSSTFKFGKGSGALLAACRMLKLSVLKVSPQRWKKQVITIPDDIPKKKASLFVARNMWGKKYFPLEKDHNKAEAALLAYYGILL